MKLRKPVVGTHPCILGGRHRTHLCQRCEHEQFNPPLGDGCADVSEGFTG